MSELIIKETGVIARAELDVQISTAKAYPRKPQQAMEYAVSLATMDEATAQSCFYCLPRKVKDGTKKEIRGASIRLAEIVANAWGNIHAATRIVENDGRHITAEGVAWDLESNVKMAMQNKVSIRFGEKEGKGGYTANADMQTVLSNAASAKALRNAIFKVVPKALVDRVLEKAMSFSVGDQKTISAKVVSVFDKLTKMGIDKQLILDYYGRTALSEITTEDLQSLIGVGTAIKEGHIKIDEVFKAEKEPNDGISAAEKIAMLIDFKKQVNAETGEVNE
jgi:Ca2+-binding EF-hand superfamily protein